MKATSIMKRNDEAQAGIKIIDIMRENGWDRKTVNDAIARLGIKKFYVGAAHGISVHDADVLVKELSLPKELQGETFWATYVHDARNKSYVFAKIDGIPNKHPVLIPRKWQGKMARKRFRVEKIQDTNGISWRHEWFRKLTSYDR